MLPRAVLMVVLGGTGSVSIGCRTAGRLYGSSGRRIGKSGRL